MNQNNQSLRMSQGMDDSFLMDRIVNITDMIQDSIEDQNKIAKDFISKLEELELAQVK